MLKQPTSKQIAYLDHIVQIDRFVQDVLRRHNRIGTTHWDGGTMNMLANEADHTLMVRSGGGDVVVSILAPWFCEPSAYRNAIEAAVENGLAA